MTTTQVDESSDRPFLPLLLVTLIGPLSWAAYFLVGYLIAEASCFLGLFQSTAGGLDLLVVVDVVLGLAATAVSGLSAVWAYRRWRRERSHGSETENANTFLALAAVLLGALFAFANLTAAVSLIFLEPCSWT
jgi:hypothetical protein